MEDIDKDAEIARLRWILKEYDDNIKYLLDTTKNAVRSRYKYGEENLIESLCINYLSMRGETGRGIPRTGA